MGWGGGINLHENLCQTWIGCRVQQDFNANVCQFIVIMCALPNLAVRVDSCGRDFTS